MNPERKVLTHAYAVSLERNPLIGIGPALKRSTAPTRIVWARAIRSSRATAPSS